MNTIIIGAGASGLACAIRLKQLCKNCRVTLIEHMPAVGRKILATGNGRCNLSNTKATGCKEVLDFFSSIGLITRTDNEGRIYPYSNQASTVVDLLEKQCQMLGVEIICDCNVLDVGKNLCVTTDKGVFNGDNVVIATGGMAQKNLGSNGSGYKFLEALGHSISELYPALVQLTSSSKYPKKIKGHRAKCNMKILIDDLMVKEDYGEVLFTDYGLSGIVAMNLSEAVSKNFNSKNPKKCHAVLDLVPDMNQSEIKDYVSKYKNLEGILGNTLSDIIEKQAQGDANKTASFAKNWKLIITGTKGYDFAQVTGGGADINEFNNLESKKIKGLYACGEILDRQFECGGFNLNFAWYTGIKAAEAIYSKVNNYDKD